MPAPSAGMTNQYSLRRPGHGAAAAVEPGPDVVERRGLAIKVSLRRLDPLVLEEGGLGFALDPLRHQLDAECLRQGYDRAHDGGGLLVFGQFAHERAVELDAVDREAPQIGQRA